MNYAAELDANGDVIRVIVIPEGEDGGAYCAALGLPGTWAAAPELCGIGQHRHGGRFYYQWQQIAGADLGPEGAESGYPVGHEVWHNGAVWVSRAPNNVNAPSLSAPTTWGRADGTYTVPAGWQYQIGEDITEDGQTWWRVTQATSFRPSESPAQFVQVDGPGGAVVTPPPPPGPLPWVQPTGAHNAYALNAVVTHAGQTWRSTYANNVWEPGVFGWVIHA